MKRLLKILKIAGIALFSLIIVLAIIITIFINMSPQFGAFPTDEKQVTFSALSNYRDGKFQNQIPTSVKLGLGKTISIMGEFLFGNRKEKDPEGPLPMVKIDSAVIADTSDDIARFTWFGHSAILLELDGKKIFLDPMLGQHAGPVPLLSPKRYNSKLPIEIESMPFMDAVVISHDHYDHLDYGSIRRLKDKTRRFFVPLGVASHLKSWGVDAEKITELNWWEEASFDGFTFICAPARHFSGRGFTNNTTLWSSWIIKSETQRLFFSGDSGYGPHFKEIGDEHGPFDFVMMECGQYNELWKAIHMMPEETVQAALDVKGEVLLPIHWGAFTLAMHPWREPIIRVTLEAERLKVPIVTPKIGQPVSLDTTFFPSPKWW